ncbi:hypothetical protein ACFLUH_01240 [Chloroflexota bacterium]
MKRVECSNCNGDGEIKVIREEALEQALTYFLKLNNESYEIDYRPCPRCNGRGTESEVELKDFCRILSQ